MLWCDGRVVEGPIPFDLSDRGLLLGDGVFDTALACDGHIAFEDAHVARLAAAAQTLGFAIAPERIVAAMRAVAAAAPRTAIRTTVTRGPGPRGIAPPAETRPFLFAHSGPMRPGLAFAPMRLHRTAIRRNETSPASRLKSLGYLDAVLAARDAAAAGFDEALFLNTGGRVACAGIGNIFGVFGQKLVTPSLEEGVLPGIVRAQVFAVAPRLGLAVDERPLPLDELEGADAVILTNSLRLVGPVTAIGDRALDSAGNATVARLSQAIREAVAASCKVAPETVS